MILDVLKEHLPAIDRRLCERPSGLICGEKVLGEGFPIIYHRSRALVPVDLFHACGFQTENIDDAIFVIDTANLQQMAQDSVDAMKASRVGMTHDRAVWQFCVMAVWEKLQWMQLALRLFRDKRWPPVNNPILSTISVDEATRLLLRDKEYAACHEGFGDLSETTVLGLRQHFGVTGWNHGKDAFIRLAQDFAFASNKSTAAVFFCARYAEQSTIGTLAGTLQRKSGDTIAFQFLERCRDRLFAKAEQRIWTLD